MTWAGITDTRARTVAAAIGSLVAFAVVLAVGVWTNIGQWLDARVFSLVLDGLPAGFRRDVASVGRTAIPLALAPVVSLLVLLTVARGRWHRFPLLLAPPLSMWVSQWLRDEVIERPDLGIAGYAHNTFPSTHACAGFALIGLGILLWPRAPGPITLALAAVLTGLVALGNIAWYAHRPVDVLGSLLLVVTAILLTYAAQLAPWDRVTDRSSQ